MIGQQNSVGQQQLWEKSEECLFHNFNPSQYRHVAGHSGIVDVSTLVLRLPTVLDKNVRVSELNRCHVEEFCYRRRLNLHQQQWMYNLTSEG